MFNSSAKVFKASYTYVMLVSAFTWNVFRWKQNSCLLVHHHFQPQTCHYDDGLPVGLSPAYMGWHAAGPRPRRINCITQTNTVRYLAAALRNVMRQTNFPQDFRSWMEPMSPWNATLFSPESSSGTAAAEGYLPPPPLRQHPTQNSCLAPAELILSRRPRLKTPRRT